MREVGAKIGGVVQIARARRKIGLSRRRLIQFQFATGLLKRQLPRRFSSVSPAL